MDPVPPLEVFQEIEAVRKKLKEDAENEKSIHRDLSDVLKSEGVLVHLPGEPEYERSVANPNLLYRFSRPGCVVQPLSASDVQTVIREATERNIPMTIKGGGHSYSGFSTTSNGISLDLGKMNRARLNLKVKDGPPVMTMQGGAQWGHAYKHLINGKHDGLIVNGGRCPTVGVGGFILGGGLAPFGRSFGLGSDTLLEATIVTANAEIITVSRKDLDLEEGETDPEKIKKRDLFWALCGAGGGNFGVVVEFKLEVQRLSLDNPLGLVVAGKYEWQPKYEKDEGNPNAKAVVTADTIKTMNRFYSYDWPNRCTIDTSWICTIGKPLTIRFLVYYDGVKSQFTQLIDADGVPEDQKPIPNQFLRRMITKRTVQEPSTRFLHETLVDQWSDEIVRAFPTNKGYSLYASFVFPNGIETIKAITSIINEDMAKFQDRYSNESATMQVTWIHSGGKVAEWGDSETAYPWRQGVYNVYVMLQWDGKWLEMDLRGWLQVFRKKLQKYSLDGKAAYVNFPFPDGMDLSGTDYEHAYYGKNCEKLWDVKAKWDPHRYFQWCQGIQVPRFELKESTSKSYRLAPEKLEEAELVEAELVSCGPESEIMEETKIASPDPEPEDSRGRESVPIVLLTEKNTFSVVNKEPDGVSIQNKEDKASDRKLADQLALEQWKTFEPFGSWSAPSGGIYALTDLGF
ncbi:hypothetical protein TWF718_008315 [Orbilia javanica]|uniref:FAD-binding PCMH-type domain-containing protein n=1 Tax=Orbilia javanica TaxID=47235 RepID=A0AAN8MWS9_9PEZI